MVRRDARPVQRERADAQAVVPGPDLLRRDAARPHPARPREEGQDREQVTGQGVVGEAREEEDEEEAHPRRAIGRLPALLRLVQRPAFATQRFKGFLIRSSSCCKEVLMVGRLT